MSNPWIKHVKKYASDHNISYGCAISHPDCKNTYVRQDPIEKKQKQKELDTRIMTGISKDLISKMNNQLPLAKSRFKQTSPAFKQFFKTNHPEEYNKLFSK